MTLDPSDNFITQAAHFFFAMCVMLTVVLLFGAGYEYDTLIIGTLLAALKEFVWDILLESPEVSGRWTGGWVDFSFYALGLLAGVAVLFNART